MNKTVAYWIDKNIPRNTSDQPDIVVDQRDYLSRLANLKSKYLGIKHRKEQWDNLVTDHLRKINNKIPSDDDVSKYSELPEGSTVTINIEYRDARLENEFNALLFSMSSTLSALTYVITSFIKGSHKMHSHNGLVKMFSKNSKQTTLSSLVIKNNQVWINELKTRRDTATHYISLLLKSELEKTINIKEKPSMSLKESTLGIMKDPIKKNFKLHQDIPLLEGAEHKSEAITHNGSTQYKEQIFDMSGNLVYESTSESIQRVELISAVEYMNSITQSLESYIVAILKELNKKLR